MISFADSTTPELIPSAFTHVAAYANGTYQWPAEQLARFPAHVLIAVRAGDPQQAKEARVLDIERFDAVAADFPRFVEERRAAGHNDATAYTSILGDPGINGIAAVVTLLARYNIALETVRFWVAWWWGREFPPTAAEVLAEIKALTGLTLPLGCLWGCQWQNGQQYDSSVLYQRDDFTRP